MEKASRTFRLFLEQAMHHLKQDFLPKIEVCLSKLSEEELWWRPNPKSNSVGNLLLHLSGNIRQWIITGLSESEDTREREKEFTEQGPVPKAELLALLRNTVDEAANILNELDESALLKRRTIQVYDVHGVEAVFHAVEHFSHHTGQIIYITKLLKGEDLRFYDL